MKIKKSKNMFKFIYDIQELKKKWLYLTKLIQ